ncbi:MAG: type II methionyl aminopeptidase [Candidatus Pacearchaeota archaeon]|nr:type II methionyl aminopeptidase [Candidatus Pacearchaeota archaeon]
MTEKQYGGSTGRSSGEIKTLKTPINKPLPKIQKEKKQETKLEIINEYEDYIKAGKIASEIAKFAKSFIKKDSSLIEIAEKIESEIIKKGAKPAFPVNLSINEIAAHDTPLFNDTRKACGLLKVDIGVHLNGSIADIAFSLDLENNEENQKLIKASEEALMKAIEILKPEIQLRQIGSVIDKIIKSYGFTSIRNLSGHSLAKYELHSGLTIPNYDNSQEFLLPKGIYAIEPFATNGFGSVKEGKPSSIFRIEKDAPVRDSFSREVLAFIYEEYKTLPFCSRWLCKKFGSRALIALKRLEDAGILHQYPQLIEVSGKKVSQAEHTIIIDKDKTITTI